MKSIVIFTFVLVNYQTVTEISYIVLLFQTLHLFHLFRTYKLYENIVCLPVGKHMKFPILFGKYYLSNALSLS